MSDVLGLIKNLQEQLMEILKLEQILSTRVTTLDTRITELENDREKLDERLHSVEPHI